MHGQEAGDTIKAVNFNRRVVFSSSVSFGNSQENTAYILNNGLIAFGNDITLGDPNIEYSFSQKQRIIAPFWANVDPNGVEVHHHLYEQYGAAAFGESEDNKPPPHQSNITTRVETDISKFHHLEGFTASSVLVVTWVSARPLTTSQTTENNTFQAVFVSGWKSESNGGMTLAENETSFVIYIYQQGKMNWKFIP
ncbi:alpha-tectorin-like [Physella acuta]|uniref:alpha-tectorin-like n=1 Tax=Physella acuta TaxID=109671 RepID=UPI0027DB02BE|nr:alpha-tectorin-like [Physella acuta]